MCTKTIFIEYFYSTILFFMQTISSIDTFDFSFLTGSGEYCGFPSKIERIKRSKNNNNDRDSKQRLVESAKLIKYTSLQHSS